MSIFIRVFGLQPKSRFNPNMIVNDVLRMSCYLKAQHQMTREIVKELDSKLFITLDGYDELVKQQGFASTWRKFKAAQEQTKQE